MDFDLLRQFDFVVVFCFFFLLNIGNNILVVEFLFGSFRCEVFVCD